MEASETCTKGLRVKVIKYQINNVPVICDGDDDDKSFNYM